MGINRASGSTLRWRNVGAQTSRFSASVAAALGKFSPVLGVVLGLVAMILLATQFVSPIANLFNFARVEAGGAGIIALASMATLILLERLKPLWGSRLLE